MLENSVLITNSGHLKYKYVDISQSPIFLNWTYIMWHNKCLVKLLKRGSRVHKTSRGLRCMNNIETICNWKSLFLWQYFFFYNDEIYNQIFLASLFIPLAEG